MTEHLQNPGARAPEVTSLRRKTVTGVMWTGLAKMSMQLVLFAVMLILARLLSPDDFGVVGMAAIVTVAITMVNDRGLGMAIVQRSRVPRSHLSSLFWGSLLFGLLLYGLSAVVAVPAASFFHKPIVQDVFRVQALGFIIGSFGIVQKSLLTKALDFKKLALIEVASAVGSGFLSIALAVLGFGVWSLVLGVLVRDGITSLALWFATPWRPGLHFSWREFKQYLGFSAQVLSNNVALYANTNADVTIIGRVLGAELLGFYSFALYMVKLPVTRLSGIVAKVVFPAFSRIQNDLQAFRSAFLKAITFISLLTFPLLAGLGVFAREFIVVFLKEKWLTMTVPLQILVPMAMLKSVGTLKGSVLMARGRPDIELKWNLIYLLPLVAAVLVGTRFGLVGVAAAFTLLYLLTFPIIQTITNRQIGVSALEFLGALRSTGLAVMVMVGAGLLARHFMKNVFIFSDMAVLVIGLAASGSAYLLTLWIVQKDILVEFVDLVRHRPESRDRKADVPLTELMVES